MVVSRRYLRTTYNTSSQTRKNKEAPEDVRRSYKDGIIKESQARVHQTERSSELKKNIRVVDGWVPYAHSALREKTKGGQGYFEPHLYLYRSLILRTGISKTSILQVYKTYQAACRSVP